MIYIYVIKSLNKSYRYVGITNNLENRFERHNLGYNKATKPYSPFKLVLIEEYPNYTEARVREKFLKSGKGREYLDSLEK